MALTLLAPDTISFGSLNLLMRGPLPHPKALIRRRYGPNYSLLRSSPLFGVLVHVLCLSAKVLLSVYHKYISDGYKSCDGHAEDELHTLVYCHSSQVYMLEETAW